MDGNEIRRLTEFKSCYARWLWKTFGFHSGYSRLFDFLYDTEFTWVLEMDENRAINGVYLRDRFCYETGEMLPDGWRDWPCSVLEMLGSLALTMEESFLYNPADDTGPSVWFWEMLDNCRLSEYDDMLIDEDRSWANASMREIMSVILNREYGPSGEGGLFPLKNPEEDQRNVEIWNQMNAYVIENWLS